uniref:Uncharacterized protein n=1 Tax=Eubacterium cellulosolvens (strain ATCC 43171 / JCM 9499 / 6) TaxID=633697 RepID=I5AWX0_EUBC6
MKEKYALLDTDYISKTHMIRKDDMYAGKFEMLQNGNLRYKDE